MQEIQKGKHCIVLLRKQSLIKMTARIEFNTKNFYLLGADIGWCRAHCPVCGKYHSQNFLPVLVRGKKEYTSRCERCQEKVITDMGTVEQNDKLLDFLERGAKKIEDNVTRSGNQSLGEWA